MAQLKKRGIKNDARVQQYLFPNNSMSIQVYVLIERKIFSHIGV